MLSYTAALALFRTRRLGTESSISKGLSIEEVALSITRHSLCELPFSGLLRNLILTTYGEDVDLFTNDILNLISRFDDTIVEFWFRDNRIDSKGFSLISHSYISFPKLCQAIQTADSKFDFTNIINYNISLDTDDWYNDVNDPSIIPFQYNRLHPDDYPFVLNAPITRFLKTHPSFNGLLDMYDENNTMDQFVLIWCLKTFQNVTFPRKCVFYHDEKAIWVRSTSYSNATYAVAILFAYLAIKARRTSEIEIFFGGSLKNMKLSKRYFVALGILRYGSTDINPELRNNRMDLIREAYRVRNSVAMKKVLLY
jgi:hypothetical protein